MSTFSARHIGPSEREIVTMLGVVGANSMDALLAQTVPENIRLQGDLTLPAARSEEQALAALRDLMDRNVVAQSFIGAGYHGTHTPAVIRRNILENPAWYTAYTPYQAEIAQGRLEALLNFQTMVCDLTGMEISNASLLDEATAAAEAMALCHDIKGGEAFFVADHCHPQAIALLRTRAEPLGIRHLGSGSIFLQGTPKDAWGEEPPACFPCCREASGGGREKFSRVGVLRAPRSGRPRNASLARRPGRTLGNRSP